MKIPVEYNGLSEIAKREWLKVEIAKVQRYEKQLLKLSRGFAESKAKHINMDNRPDLGQLKPE